MPNAELVWDEYKYRHTHIWNTVYRLTYTVAFLSALPYLDQTVTARLGSASLSAPLVAIALAAAGLLAAWRELQVLGGVKREHRRLNAYADPPRPSLFRPLVLTYLGILLLGAAANLWIVKAVWLPSLDPRGGSICEVKCPSG